MEDSKIVDLYLERNEAAIQNTSKKYGVALRGMAFRVVGDALASEECENDTYWEAWNLIPPHEPRTYLFAFLGRITRHLAIGILRKTSAKKRSAPVVELSQEMEQCIPSQGDISESVDAQELGKSISGFLATLKEEQRSMFVRRYWFFDPISDIAKRYGYSESKVKSTLFRTREKLQTHLEKEGYSL